MEVLIVKFGVDGLNGTRILKREFGAVTLHCFVCASPLFPANECSDVRLHAQSVNISKTREF